MAGGPTSGEGLAVASHVSSWYQMKGDGEDFTKEEASRVTARAEVVAQW